MVDVAEFIGDTLSYVLSAWNVHCPLVEITRFIRSCMSYFQYSGDESHQKDGAVPRHAGVTWPADHVSGQPVASAKFLTTDDNIHGDDNVTNEATTATWRRRVSSSWAAVSRSQSWVSVCVCVCVCVLIQRSHAGHPRRRPCVNIIYFVVRPNFTRATKRCIRPLR